MSNTRATGLPVVVTPPWLEKRWLGALSTKDCWLVREPRRWLGTMSNTRATELPVENRYSFQPLFLPVVVREPRCGHWESFHQGLHVLTSPD